MPDIMLYPEPMRAAGAASIAWMLITLFVTANQSRPAYYGTLENHPAIDYRAGETHDAVTALRRDLVTGAAALSFSGEQGYLRAVLAKLEIPIESQLLLFSKTGIQNAHTSPEHPRALYFNDHVIVGYIPGAPLL